MRIRPLAEADAEALPPLVAGLNEAMGDPVGAFTAAHARAHILAPGAGLRCLVAEESSSMASASCKSDQSSASCRISSPRMPERSYISAHSR